MTRTVARLILAMLLLPLTGAVFLILAVGLIATSPSGPPAIGRLLLAVVDPVRLRGAYWILLWRARDMVTWNRRRSRLTALATVLSLAGGVAVAMGILVISRYQVPPQIATMIGGGTVPITWVLSTVLLWRETAGERLGRLTAHGMPAVACPLCGYDLAGLTEARCPECGSRFTLEQIVLAQAAPSGTQPTEL